MTPVTGLVFDGMSRQCVQSSCPDMLCTAGVILAAMASVTRKTQGTRQKRREDIERRLLDATERLMRDGASFTELSVDRLATEADLLVADDVSSALDATTELELWQALRERGLIK